MVKLKNIIGIREIYILLVLVLATMLFSIYSSFALFKDTIESVGIASLVAIDVTQDISSTEGTFSLSLDKHSGTITVNAGEEKFFDLKVTSTKSIDTKYKLYYKFSGGVEVIDVYVGVSNKSISKESENLLANGDKTVRVGIINDSDQNATIEIGVQGGYSNNPVVLSDGKKEMDTINEVICGEDEPNPPELAEGMIPVVYDDTKDVWVKAEEIPDCAYRGDVNQNGKIDSEDSDIVGRWIANQPQVLEQYSEELMIKLADVDKDNEVNVVDINNIIRNEGKPVCSALPDKYKREKTAYYCYEGQKWANAVTVTSDKRDIYTSANVGTEIPMNDINSMWVWIPRYKYKIPTSIGIPTSSPPVIDVVFEPMQYSTGVSEQEYRDGIQDNGTNNNYYTHPAFKNGTTKANYKTTAYDLGGWSKDSTGIWVGKFETGGEKDAPLIKPDIQSLSLQNVASQFKTALLFANGSMDDSTGTVTFMPKNNENVYGLNETTDYTNTHMMKNTEWGMVAYFTQSKYGKAGNRKYSGENKALYVNNSYNEYTGRSSGSISAKDSTYGEYSYNDKTCAENVCTGPKVKNAGQGASTTGTIYGIYDMGSPSHEHVMGNLNNLAGSCNFGSGFNGKCSSGYTDQITDGISFPEAKYYDKYTVYDDTKTSTKEKAIMGDATWETKGWFNNNSSALYMDTDDYFAWYERGYSVYQSGAQTNTSQLFGFRGTYGYQAFGVSFRTVLIP